MAYSAFQGGNRVDLIQEIRTNLVEGKGVCPNIRLSVDGEVLAKESLNSH